jgi:photosystem II stability/assembly factor-like uncharacterized protein
MPRGMVGIAYQDSLTVTLVGRNGIVQSGDGGATWVDRRSPPGEWTAVAFATAETGVAVGYNGRIVRTTDSGRTWSPVDAPAGVERLAAVAFADELTGVAVGDKGALVRTSDGGATWRPVRSGTDEVLRAIQFVGQRGWAVGHKVLLRTTDAGNRWRAERKEDTRYFDVAFLDERRGVVVGRGMVHFTNDGGEHWSGGVAGLAEYVAEARRRGFVTERNELSAASFEFVAMPSPGTIVTMGPYNSAIARSVDGGGTWSVVDAGERMGFLALAFRDGRNGLALGYNGVYRTEDGGATWANVAGGSTRLAAGALSGNWTVRVVSATTPSMSCEFDEITSMTLTHGDSAITGNLNSWRVRCRGRSQRASADLNSGTTTTTTAERSLDMTLPATPVAGWTDRLRAVRFGFDERRIRARFEGDLHNATAMSGQARFTLTTEELGTVELTANWTARR